MSIFIEQVDKLLSESGKTKIELAKYAGISTQSFYDWKNRNTVPAADVAVKIADFLNTSVEFLVTGEEKNIYKKKYDTLLADIESSIEKVKND